MKTILYFLSFYFFSFSVMADQSSVDLLCDANNKVTSLATRVTSGTVVKIYGHEWISGFRWTSKDGIESQVIVPAPIGEQNTIAFTIDTAKQRPRSKTYVFELKRSWETLPPQSVCRVTVVRK